MEYMHLKLFVRRISSYFGDLKDGIHKGDEHDPRVSIIEVVPNEICYWVATQGTVARAVGGLIDTVTGKTNVPGELRTFLIIINT